MIYSTDDMELQVIATCFTGSVNDVVVCRNILSPVDERYTLVVVHDRDCVKTLLSVFDSSESEPPYKFCFARNEALIFGFPFRPDRKFSSFAKVQMLTPSIGETIGVNLVMECISGLYPPALLYLMLTQDNVNISKENSVYITPNIDLSLLDISKTERDCTVRCAEQITELLGSAEKSKKKKLKSCELIRKKCSNSSYSSFSELYRDIRLTAIPEHGPGIKSRLKGLWLRSRDRLFHILLVICVLIVIAALVMLISQLFLSDIPLLRLFRHCFDVIGTEHLN